MRLLSTCVATMLALAAASAASATEIFLLNIEGIPGTSTVPGHTGLIPVTSFSDSISNRYSAGSARAAGPFACQPLQITKVLDSSSPHLFMAVATGKIYPQIILQALTTGEGGVGAAPTLFMELTLVNAVISSVKLGGDASNSARTETLTINAEHIMVQVSGVGASNATVTCGGLGL